MGNLWIKPLLSAAIFLSLSLYSQLSSAQVDSGDTVFDLDAVIESSPPAPQPQAIGDVRVQVFPHLGKYASPHAREKTIQTVSLVSKANCRVNGKEVKAGSYMTFSLAKANFPAEIDCDEGSTTKVIRDKGMAVRSYFGDFLIRAGATKEGRKFVRVINILPFEEYLRGVIPSEMPASWGKEALKAQAVAARTYAAFEILLARSMGDFIFDVDDTVFYQAYMGAATSVSTDDAISETRGEIMVYGDGIVRAYFSADSGGISEKAEEVWPNRTPAPYTAVVTDPYDLTFLPKAWKYSFSLSTIGSKLRKREVIGAKDVVAKIQIPENGGYSDSGRVATVEIEFKKLPGEDTARKMVMAGTDFQYSLGLPSALFTLNTKGTIITFNGRGNGHGVGMSQWGARFLEREQGFLYPEILNHYYKDVQLTYLDEK